MCGFTCLLTMLNLSVHVPKPGALVTDTWFAYDAEKYNESELSLLEWGRTQFSEHCNSI